MKFDISRRTFLRTTIGTLLVGPYVWTALLRKDSCFGNLNVLASDTTVLEWKETQERFFQKWKRFCSKGFPPIRYTELGKRTATIRCWEAKQYVFGGMSVQVNGVAADVSDITAENLQSFDVIQGVVTLSDKPQYAVLDVKQHYRFWVGYESPPPNRKKSDSGSRSYAKIQAEAKKTGRTAFVGSNGWLRADEKNVSGVFGEMSDEEKKILNTYTYSPPGNAVRYDSNNIALLVWKDSQDLINNGMISTLADFKNAQVGNPVRSRYHSSDMPPKVDSIVRYNGCDA
ncbi:hypothetical protein FACS189419_03530 [Planctomycetales bacterium]|nr:hypothetical protein FACS189419_03530 [Planctomycetales bacterium]